MAEEDRGNGVTVERTEPIKSEPWNPRNEAIRTRGGHSTRTQPSRGNAHRPSVQRYPSHREKKYF